MQIDHADFVIGSHFLSALINDDYTGLSDSEEAALFAWLDANGKPDSHWDVLDYGDNFAVCEINNIHSDCATVRMYWGV